MGIYDEVPGEKYGSVLDPYRKSAEVNVVNALAQKAPGVEITSQSGDPGAGSGIIIRGFKTIQGTGQPLFVVDGVPIDNSVSVTDASDTGFGYSNRALDLNPQDIESVEVLKGPSAAALYGLRAANGVVQITTRAGRAGATRYQLSSNTTFDEVNRDVPLQQMYGRGLGGATPTCRPDQNCQLRSWGAQLPAGTQTFDHFSTLFRTGNTFDNTLQVSGGDTQRSFFLSGGNLDQRGVSRGPNSTLDRRSFRLRATQALGDKLRLGGNFNYTDLAQRGIQKGNNLNGLLLGSTRQPPEYNPFSCMAEVRAEGPGLGSDSGLRGPHSLVVIG
jgi:TonB-dependent SusC/RagA subfamily outer membrane receptor